MALFGRPTERDEAKAAAYRAWLLRRHPFAIAATVLGVFSLTHFGTLIVDGVVAIVLGVLALRQLDRANSFTHVSTTAADNADHAPPTEGRGLAWLGISTAALSLLLAIFLAYGRG
ncbi:MAG: DUF4190 domain-containing protein [Tepidisphaeraceae bacterium]